MKSYDTKRNRSWIRIGLGLIAGLGLLCLAAGLASFIINRQLPTRSSVVDRLNAAEKAHLAEAIHLRKTLGNQIWPGWGQLEIPIIVYNESSAFLVGYANPAVGWKVVPDMTPQGGAWEAVEGDSFLGQPYFRQPLPNPAITPQSFTVVVGETWVATLQTHEYSLITFASGLRDELPPIVREVFPYKLFWQLLMGDSEAYIAALEHESFHAFQGKFASERLAEAERSLRMEDSYPWEDADREAAWSEELDLLVKAVRADTDEQALELARQFLALRDQRRNRPTPMAKNLVDMERQREWLEGLAKYVELTSGREAALSPQYIPADESKGDPSFSGYAKRIRFFDMQLDEVRRMDQQQSETRFYYSGMAQAVLLDRLLPDWKDRPLAEIQVEDLIQEACRP